MTHTSAKRKRACIVGGGVIGGGWAARFLLHGWDVSVYDPQDGARKRLERVLASAREYLPALADVAMPAEGTLSLAATLEEAVVDADWVQESVPEDLALKQRVIAAIEAAVAPDAIIASSTSGFRPAELREGAKVPGRILVAHPFNPVYLLPLAEVVGGADAADGVAARAAEVLSGIGMHPLAVQREIDAHIADRLLESVWRECLWLVHDDIATTEEIDDAIRYGFGLRWAQMGIFETYRLAGGDAGMVHFLEQFGPALKWPWTHLMDVPDMTPALAAKIGAQSDAQSGMHSIAELERIRDRNLVGILRALKAEDFGAGALLNAHDRRLEEAQTPASLAKIEAGVPLRLLESRVLPAWIDYNGHMTEHRYLEVFGYTTDCLLRLIGMDDDYVAGGNSYYTVETHIQHLDETAVGERMYSTIQLLAHDEKRLHIFQRLHARADDRLLATAEQMLLHVDASASRACPAAARLLDALAAIATAHADLPAPATAGRHVGQSRTN